MGVGQERGHANCWCCLGVVVWEPSSRIGGDGRLAKGEIVDANRVLSVWEERWVAMRGNRNQRGMMKCWPGPGQRWDAGATFQFTVGSERGG